MIAFDDDVARRLATGARTLDELLYAQSRARLEAVGDALHDFAGGHRVLFEAAVAAEALDRTILARRLDSLARQIERMRAAAERERQRQAAIALWEAQCAQWHEHAEDMPAAERAWGPPREPHESVEALRPLTAAFSARSRERSGGRSGDRTSADPERLRSFAQRTRSSGVRLLELLDEVEVVWRRFQEQCSWAPVGRVTAFNGLRELIAENDADADWMDRVAAAFEAAGGGSLSSAAVQVACAPSLHLSDPLLLSTLATLDPHDVSTLWAARPELQKELLALDAAGVNSWWHTLDGEPGTLSPRQTVLLDACPSLFGTLEGIPYGARDRANRAALTARIDALTTERDAALLRAEEVRDRPGATTLEIAAATTAVTRANEHLRPLLNIRESLMPVAGKSKRFLCSLTADQPPLAALSIGDLDSASTVIYAVPGMGTTTADMSSWSKTSQQMADLVVGTKAVVAWIGYETPPVPDLINQDLTVFENDLAREGGAALAKSLRGLSAVRRDNPVVPDVIGHSFGSTTAAFGMLEDGVQVDAFVILGSAGLPPEAGHASDLHANAVYPAQAHSIAPWDDGGGDKWAQIGRGPLSQHQVDPMDPSFGGHPFGVETGGDAGRIVTDHEALISDNGPRAGYFDKNTEASLNAARAIQGDLDGITPYSRPEPVSQPAETPQ
ncbi:alpha/beta hydrolase [Rathayibacter iranicus]|uniref:alpha/beta hydrolase n=1 Tax=Rathayibacter iranicus TaxID=59737 RepID=UPI000CE8302E|nr:alpha/beta hydrolase [Rathayibacter iranicus]PPI47684.1 hypothetical protein C5E09_06450 [Rathayibacter iranicus]PPI73210.1 hypothetical protein C5E01_03270 [Rathayibacter iranicus]